METKIANLINELGNNPIDGHFWIEVDGKIIDPYFKFYDYVKKVHNAKSITHLPADDTTQKIIIKMYEKFILKHFNNMEEYYNAINWLFEGKTAEGYCHMNACTNMMKFGGKLVFGSLGFVREDSSVHYEYGGVNWTVKQFFKR